MQAAYRTHIFQISTISYCNIPHGVCEVTAHFFEMFNFSNSSSDCYGTSLRSWKSLKLLLYGSYSTQIFALEGMWLRPCSLGTWAENRDAVLSSFEWDNSGMSPFLFEMGSRRIIKLYYFLLRYRCYSTRIWTTSSWEQHTKKSDILSPRILLRFLAPYWSTEYIRTNRKYYSVAAGIAGHWYKAIFKCCKQTMSWPQHYH